MSRDEEDVIETGSRPQPSNGLAMGVGVLAGDEIRKGEGGARLSGIIVDDNGPTEGEI